MPTSRKGKKMIEMLNCDCMEYMAGLPDKAFDLAIVDPPYGIGFGEFNRTNKTSSGERFKANKYKHGDWDTSAPPPEYFKELFRVSKNQIIWGGNYFPSLWVSGCKGFIFWNKGNPVDNFADGELAWTSFDKPAKQFDFKYYGNLEGKTSAQTKIHPTQKPVALYKWLLSRYAKPGDRILDTHGRIVGSHRGALHYTIGQRKGLGMGFGHRVYVLDVNQVENTVTIGERSEWPHQGFFLDSVNYMKIASLQAPLETKVKVRYKQDPMNATIRLTGEGLWVDYPDLFAPGQLAVAYDQDGAILLAGFIRSPRPRGRATERTAWSLMRQDDNGHRFLISVHASKAQAQHALSALEGRHHKQMYWIEPAHTLKDPDTQ